ncbi:MAG TPA: hypothetical protein VF816_13905 [Rhodocyclaceae bacterium]
MAEEQQDGRMSFDEAVHYVQTHPDHSAFAAMPVFGERSEDAEQRAEGARVFVLRGNGTGSHEMLFIAGPFFANVFAAHETFAAADIPERVRELRFMPTRLDEEWLSGQMQFLIQNLVQASGAVAPEMPHYEAEIAHAEGEVAIPLSSIGGRGKGKP